MERRPQVKPEQIKRPHVLSEIIGRQVCVWWEGDKRWYTGCVRQYDAANDLHTILYQDGEQQGEPLNDPAFMWKFIDARDSGAMQGSANANAKAHSRPTQGKDLLEALEVDKLLWRGAAQTGWQVRRHTSCRG